MKMLVMFFLLLSLVLVSAQFSLAQDHTYGVIVHEAEAYDGYTLVVPNASTTTYLIDNYGRVVHSWESIYPPAQSAYLLENGKLLRTIKLPEASGPGQGGGFQLIAWDGTIEWEYQYHSENYWQHHDIEYLPNGNVLVLAWDIRSQQDAIDAGRNPALVLTQTVNFEKIIEVEQTGPTSGNIVWEWQAWDHMIQDFDPFKDNYGVIADHPELSDINYSDNTGTNLYHANGLSYNAEFDQIVISLLRNSEVWIIDHSTTTAEAAGHSGGLRGMGGDILYRWGNPRAYDAGSTSDQVLYTQHSPHWIEDGYPDEGKLMIFNNGSNRPGGDHSSVEVVSTSADEFGSYPVPTSGAAHAPASSDWTYRYTPSEAFFAPFMSGARRMPNGNTLICSAGNGWIFEVTPAEQIVWEYHVPVNGTGQLEQGSAWPQVGISVFRAYRYPKDYAGLFNQTLIPGTQIETYPITVDGTIHTPFAPDESDSVIITSLITSDFSITSVQLMYDTGVGDITMTMLDDGNHHDNSAGDGIYGAIIPPVSSNKSVTYHLIVDNSNSDIVNDPPLNSGIAYSYDVTVICGDVFADGALNLQDILFMIDHIYGDPPGPMPDPEESGDVNNDGSLNLLDILILISYIYDNPPGPEPQCPWNI